MTKVGFHPYKTITSRIHTPVPLTKEIFEPQYRGFSGDQLLFDPVREIENRSSFLLSRIVIKSI